MADAAETDTETKQADTGKAADTAAPSVDPARLAQLEAAAAKLAKIEADQAAAAQAEALRKGEHEKVIASLKAEAEATKATAARTAEDLALADVHAGFAGQAGREAREVARALYAAMPEDKRAQSVEAQVRAWAKKPDEAPAGLRAYLTTAAPVSVGTRTTGNTADSGAEERAALQWAQQRGLFVGAAEKANPDQIAAFVALYRKNKKAG